MTRRFTALLLALPLMVAGGVGAHWLAYRLAVPDAGARRTLLAASGHAYAARVPVVIGVLGAVSLTVLTAIVLRAGSAVTRLRLPRAVFVTLPMISFAVQELAERVMVGYDSPWHVWVEPTFWRGLVLQVPFGLVAYLVASLLVRGAAAVERIVARRRDRVRHSVASAEPPRGLALGLIVRAGLVRAGDALAFRGPPAAMIARR